VLRKKSAFALSRSRTNIAERRGGSGRRTTRTLSSPALCLVSEPVKRPSPCSFHGENSMSPRAQPFACIFNRTAYPPAPRRNLRFPRLLLNLFETPSVPRVEVSSAKGANPQSFRSSSRAADRAGMRPPSKQRDRAHFLPQSSPSI